MIKGSDSEDTRESRGKGKKKSWDLWCYVTEAWGKRGSGRTVYSAASMLHSLIREPECQLLDTGNEELLATSETRASENWKRWQLH